MDKFLLIILFLNRQIQLRMYLIVYKLENKAKTKQFREERQKDFGF